MRYRLNLFFSSVIFFTVVYFFHVPRVTNVMAQACTTGCPRAQWDAATLYDPTSGQCFSWGDGPGWNIEIHYQACGPVKCPNRGNDAQGNTCAVSQGGNCYHGYGATGMNAPGCILQDNSCQAQSCPNSFDFVVQVIDKNGKGVPGITIHFNYEDNPPVTTTGKTADIQTDQNGFVYLNGSEPGQCDPQKDTCTASFLYPGDHVTLKPTTPGYTYQSPDNGNLSSIGDENDWRQLNGGANLEVDTLWSCGTYYEDSGATSYHKAHGPGFNAPCLFIATPNSNPPTPTATPTLTPPTPTPTQSYGISGNIFVDTNGNGSFDTSSNPPETRYTEGTSTISFSNGPTNISPITTNNGQYATGHALIAGTYTVSYSGPPPGYFMTQPLNGTIPPSFSVTVGQGQCSKGGSPDAKCANGNLSSLNFGIVNLKPWYQSFCGDMRIDSGITDNIPANPVCGSISGAYAIQTQSNYCPSSPGIAFTGNNSASFNLGQASANKWLVGGSSYPELFKPVHPGVIRTSFSYMTTTAQQSGITPTFLYDPNNPPSAICDLHNCVLPPKLPNGLYQTVGGSPTGDLHLQTYNFTGNNNYVFLINGDLYLEGAITISNGSTATFSVSGNIYVNPSVGETDPTSLQPDIAGLYSADKSFIVDSKIGSCSSGSADNKLNIAGSIVINAGLQGGSFQNNRDLCLQDVHCPAVTITQRLDLLLNAPLFIKHTNSLWQEVAP